jgi:8-oxo-dGTP diphosphatase
MNPHGPLDNPLKNPPPVEVAAAVLVHPDGAFLLAKRPAGKIWAGWWEFPGGKVEPGESSRQALVRELKEELGIEVQTAYPWISRTFDYPHATVRLNFFRVTQWRGELHPHEGQEFYWQPALACGTAEQVADVSPMLPANAPVLKALALPEAYGISNAAELGAEEFLRRLDIALDNGLKLVQVRERQMPADALRGLFRRVLERAHARGACVLLNGAVELAQEWGADGVHLSGAELAVRRERPAVKWCAASCHSAEELRRAEALGCDFAVLGPVMPTLSHPGAPHLGWEGFARLAAGASIPVYALGGLTQEDKETAWRHGAQGTALMRQAWPEISPGGSSFSPAGMR